MSSQFSFSFDISAISAEMQPVFMSRCFQLLTDYQQLTKPCPVAPEANTLPVPSFFNAVEGDDTSQSAKPSVGNKELIAMSAEARNEALGKMSNQELRDSLAEFMGKPKGRKHSSGFPNKESLVTEIKRLCEVANAPPVVVSTTEPTSDSGSVTSGSKKSRKPLTEEQKQARREKMAAKKAAKEQTVTEPSVTEPSA